MSNLRILKVLETWIEWETPPNLLCSWFNWRQSLKFVSLERFYNQLCAWLFFCGTSGHNRVKQETAGGTGRKKRDTCLSPALKTAMIRKMQKPKWKLIMIFIQCQWQHIIVLSNRKNYSLPFCIKEGAIGLHVIVFNEWKQTKGTAAIY